MNTDVPPPPDDGEPPRWADDKSAKQEARNWGNDRKLQDAKTWADVWWAKAYGIVAIFLLFVFAILFLGSLTSWAAHYILPECWHWLTGDQLSKIQSVIFSGSLGGVISIVAQKQLSK